ncbi:MAG: hypothetical protein D6795_03600 [Deltaproteobacteria bacterium]|nr:MAG: hypothetical protein D6795_03600 [Deltaproteobacteria bacterium]
MPASKEGNPRYWFPAKKYGWGWGFPSTWEGWVTLFLYGAALSLVTYLFPPREKTIAFTLLSLLLTLFLIAIAWAKGEPPTWRWGKK